MNKLPKDCSNLDEVRNEIDLIDKEIINLIAERLDFVKEVVKYRPAQQKEVPDNIRYLKVIQMRGEWAKEAGLNPTVIEDMYTRLIQYFIEEQAAIAKLENKLT